MTSSAPRFSVITPCHNTGRLITDAIRSLQRQSLSNWEMIVVDDGSSDESPAIVADWALADPRIRFVPLPANRGAAAARNIGIDLARGDYVCFLDADDVFAGDALATFETLLAGRRLDLAKGQIAVTFDDADPIRATAGVALDAPEAEVARCRVLTLADFTTHAYRRGFLEDCRIRFEEDISVGEDRLFLARAQLWCRDFAATDKVVYTYRKQNSVTMEGDWTKDKQASLTTFLTRMRMLIDSRPQADRLRSAFFLNSFPWQCLLLARTARTAPRDGVIAHAVLLRAAAVAGVDAESATGQRYLRAWPRLALKLRTQLMNEDWDAAIWTLTTEGQPRRRAA
jgi:glycosyltransferase involved in cell wall biosynthesis